MDRWREGEEGKERRKEGKKREKRGERRVEWDEKRGEERRSESGRKFNAYKPGTAVL